MLTDTSGRPQGSVFAVFMIPVDINDLPSLMENNTYLFADYTIYWRPYEFIFATKYKQNHKWSKDNRLAFKMAKTEAVCFDVKKLDKCSVHLYANNKEVTCKSSVNDICVIVVPTPPEGGGTIYSSVF